jgi:hypothetical protein
MDGVTIRVRAGGNLRGGGSGGGKGGNGTYTGTEGPFGNASYHIAEPEWGGQYWTWAGVDKTPGGLNADGWTYYKPAGYHWSINERVWYYSIYRVGPIATTSGNAGRGRGYDGANTNGVAGGTNSGLSGNGGDWGAAGTNGAAGNAGSGSNAGSPGKAANLNSRTNCAVLTAGGTNLGLVA